MAKNIKLDTASSPTPYSGWDPLNSRGNILSQLDAATGNLTGDQHRFYADMPSEVYSEQPSTSNKIIHGADGSSTYHQLVAHNGQWKDPATNTIITNVAVRP
jgi:hypothetical protein